MIGRRIIQRAISRGTEGTYFESHWSTDSARNRGIPIGTRGTIERLSNIPDCVIVAYDNGTVSELNVAWLDFLAELDCAHCLKPLPVEVIDYLCESCRA